MFDKRRFGDELDKEFYRDSMYKAYSKNGEPIDEWIENYFEEEKKHGTIKEYSVYDEGLFIGFAVLDNEGHLYHDAIKFIGEDDY